MKSLLEKIRNILHPKSVPLVRVQPSWHKSYKPAFLQAHNPYENAVTCAERPLDTDPPKKVLVWLEEMQKDISAALVGWNLDATEKRKYYIQESKEEDNIEIKKRLERHLQDPLLFQIYTINTWIDHITGHVSISHSDSSILSSCQTSRAPSP